MGWPGPQSSALAAALYNAEDLHSVRLSALVLGPYGRPTGLARFGIVLLIVEDNGIARVFSLVLTLVLVRNNTAHVTEVRSELRHCSDILCMISVRC